MSRKHKRGDGTGKLPKRIGGVKLPKKVRKAGDALIETASSPKGQQVIAAGLAMAAGAASKRARPVPPRPPIPPIPPVPPLSAHGEQPSRPGQPGIPPEFNQIVDAFSAATTAFLNGFFGRKS